MLGESKIDVFLKKKKSTGATICRRVSLMPILLGIGKIPTSIRANTSFINNDLCQKALISLCKTEGFVGGVLSFLYIFCYS